MPYFIYERAHLDKVNADHRDGASIAKQPTYSLDPVILPDWRAIAVSEHTTKAEAIAARTGDQCIQFVPTQAERNAWQQREYDRLGAEYIGISWYIGKSWHYLHHAKDHPGKVAYTPDDTYGHEDRRIACTPGRYLEQFAENYIPRGNWPEYIADVQAITLPLQFASTADDIGRVYCAPKGPSSCMSGNKGWSYKDAPVRVYAGGDLQVAYIGTLDKDDPAKDQISARAVVWPKHKTFVRTYGADELITAALQRAGYQRTSSFDGARLLAVKDGRRYICPYIDGNAQELERDGKYLVITEDGEYSASQCDGYVGSVERYSCANSDCDATVDDEGNYCDDCDEARWSCDACGEVYFDDYYQRNHDHATVCESCSDNRSHECQACGDTFNEYDYSYTERRSRDHWDLCDSCIDTHVQCERCDKYAEAGEMREHGSEGEVCAECRRALSQRRRRSRGVTIRRIAASEVVAPTLAVIQDRSRRSDRIWFDAEPDSGIRGGYFYRYTPIAYAYICNGVTLPSAIAYEVVSL